MSSLSSANRTGIKGMSVSISVGSLASWVPGGGGGGGTGVPFFFNDAAVSIRLCVAVSLVAWGSVVEVVASSAGLVLRWWGFL